jgi:arabinose-5-phosphate isomerase
MVAALFKTQKKYLDHFYEEIDIAKTEEILDRLLTCKGTIIFTGVGKSGIIANKLAMTMLSTGTKAIYISPTDALHGDLGIVSKEDILICLSNSGETKELISLAPYVKKKGAKVVAIVSKEGATLTKLADHFIILPVKKEICPYNLAPTTSTAVQLIFGDVLAVELMRRKNFTLDEYADNHPGGAIGRALTLKVKEIMLKGKDIPFCKKEDELIDVISILTEKRCGALIVVDEKKALLGIFTDGDLRRAIERDRKNFLYKKMEELMTKNPKWIDQEVLAAEAMKEMEKDPKKLVTVLPVLSDKQVVGVIRLHDILQEA